jgi:hypothetical protein
MSNLVLFGLFLFSIVSLVIWFNLIFISNLILLWFSFYFIDWILFSISFVAFDFNFFLCWIRSLFFFIVVCFGFFNCIFYSISSLIIFLLGISLHFFMVCVRSHIGSERPEPGLYKCMLTLTSKTRFGAMRGC